MTDTPWLEMDASSCLARADWREVSAAQFCKLTFEPPPGWVVEAEASAAAKFPHVATVSMNDVICPEQSCVVERAGMILYHDRHHLTATYSRELAKELWRRISGRFPS